VVDAPLTPCLTARRAASSGLAVATGDEHYDRNERTCDGEHNNEIVDPPLDSP